MVGSSCVSDTDDVAAPCNAFTERDAKALLGAGSPRIVEFSDLLQTYGNEVSPSDNPQLAVVEQNTCAYQVGEGKQAKHALYQYDFAQASFFSSKAEFFEANLKKGDAKVDGIGRAALYSAPKGNGDFGAVVVLLKGGHNFVVNVRGIETPKADLVSAAKKIAARL